MQSDFLDTFFPFAFEANDQLIVQRAGASLQKLAPPFRAGVRLEDLVRIRYPICKLTPSDLAKNTGKLFLLDLIDGDATLRGQWYMASERTFFVGSLWTRSMEDLTKTGISLQDFAPLDMTVENIMLREGQAAQAAEHRRLVDKLKTAVARESKVHAVEKALARDLDLYADLLIRFQCNGDLEDGLSTEECPIDVNGLIQNTNMFEHKTLGPTLREAVQRLEMDPEERHAVDFEFERHGRQHYFEGRLAQTPNRNYLFLARDITERREMARHLENLAHHDSLTQLPNRAYFESRLHDAFMFGHPFALMLIDVNDFKTINDSYGHLVGDCVLRGIASRIQQACEENQVAARWGGDEFAVLAEFLERPEDAQEVAERIVSNIMQPLEIEEDAILHPKVSVGVVIPRGRESFLDLLRNVDIAMYKSKSFRNDSRITSFEESMLDRFMERLVLKQDIVKALRNHELCVFYQPIFDFRQNRFTKCEALVRWQHPERGLLTPYHFVELAEESGLISKMGRQVLAQSCEDARYWLEGGLPMTISVNVSASQLQQPDFFDWIQKTMEDNGIGPHQLMIEITESVLVTNAKHANDLLIRLKDAGIRIAIDDFGVGYSSLQYLAKLPVDIVKLDKTFVQELDESSGAGYRLFEAMVNLGRTLGLEIVAEGIETKEHERQIRAFGCDYGQGYLYSRPVPLNEAFLLTHSVVEQVAPTSSFVTDLLIAGNEFATICRPDPSLG